MKFKGLSAGLILVSGTASAQIGHVDFTVDLRESEAQIIRVTAEVSGIEASSVTVKLPHWMPGYYQLMDYADDITEISAVDGNGAPLSVVPADNGWRIENVSSDSLSLSYSLKIARDFVANNNADKDHAYIVPTNTFVYFDDLTNISATVNVTLPTRWPDKIATGLKESKAGSFVAADFDVLYDSPLLAGQLEQTAGFTVNGVNHEFLGYKLGEFDEDRLLSALQKAVDTSQAIFGEMPYQHYSFIGIGPGRGGIEHLNSATVTFDGNDLQTDEDYDRVMSFLTHEYFHHYNVKRIRPFELGPFDYAKPNRTTQLWVSEGITVYYEYLVLHRAGFADENKLYQFLAKNLNAFESDEGKAYQSLRQSSFYTWEDGPFGVEGGENDRSISFYDKGTVVALLLDLAIREASHNQHSLDTVMKRMYSEYYKQKQRGFTDAEFQQACEEAAGAPLTEIFEYVSTTKPLDYEKYLGYAGLELSRNDDGLFVIIANDTASEEQQNLRTNWLKGN